MVRKKQAAPATNEPPRSRGDRAGESLAALDDDVARAMSSAPAQHAVDADLGGARIEDLDVPLFRIVTKLTRERPEVSTHGSVGLAERALD